MAQLGRGPGLGGEMAALQPRHLAHRRRGPRALAQRPHSALGAQLREQSDRLHQRRAAVERDGQRSRRLGLRRLGSVHAAWLVDVQALGCDFLACSSYKFFGPHLGVVWGRASVLEISACVQVPLRFRRHTGTFRDRNAANRAAGGFGGGGRTTSSGLARPSARTGRPRERSRPPTAAFGTWESDWR